MADTSAVDAAFMHEAIALARRGVQAGHGGPFGALIVRGGQVVGRGWNRVIVDCDPTAHAEILAIREAGARLGDHRLLGCTLYSSCEPCPMCLAAAYWARLERVVFAAGAADAAALGFDDRHILDWMTQAREGGSLPMSQIQREQALEVFRLWQEGPLRVGY
jgi:tRNA(Arg) A34 adenosine deaminase TadA